MPRAGNSCESPRVPTFQLGKSFEGGVLDAMDVEPSGEIRLFGWSRDTRSVPALRLFAEGIELASRDEFRLNRPEIALFLRAEALHLGFGIVFHAPAVVS